MMRNDRRDGPALRPGRLAARPRVDGLEDRLLLYATTGSGWTLPVRVTYSFVPDGTNVGGYPSNLYGTLTAKYPATTWVTAFLQAAATWEQIANINLVPVGDDGVPFGAGAYQQGDPGHGDIRIGGVTGLLDSSTLAVTFMPPPLNGNSLAGDMVFNSTQNFTINANGVGTDLETVAIHEFGHALGLGHSAIQSAAMYPYYYTTRQSLASDDIAGMDAIYQARQPDDWIQTWHNTTVAKAPDITPFLYSQKQLTIPNLSIQNANMVEWFKVYVPATTSGTMTVTMQSLFLSALSPQFQILDSSLQVVGYAYAEGANAGGAPSTTISVAAGQYYYIGTMAGGGGIYSAGNYALEVNFGSSAQPLVSPPNTMVANQASTGAGSGSSERTGGAGQASTLARRGPEAAIAGPADLVRIGILKGDGDALTTVAPRGRSNATPRGPHAAGKAQRPAFRVGRAAQSLATEAGRIRHG
jgi:predicted Zn-dependent protease